MPTLQLTTTIAQIRRTALAPDSDGRLLTRFIEDRDDAAFGELVRRFGPTVLGVCRRITGDAHLAEDAFQATFLVLARRAAVISPREAVRTWLHGVAFRTAQKARATSVRRRNWETLVADLPDRSAPARNEPDADLLLALDEEIAALPEHVRTAVLMCELDGLSRAEGAFRLGVPLGTLSSRLAKARRILTARLRQRGFAIPATGLSLLLARSASAVPPQLTSATAALADGSVPVSAAVASLSRGVIRTMFLMKLKVGVLAGLLLVAVGWALDLPREPAAFAGQPPAPAAKPDEKKPAAKATGSGTLLLARQDDLVTLTPDGKKGVELTAPKNTRTAFQGRLSPDGTRVAFVVVGGKLRRPGDDGDPWPFQVVIHKLSATDPMGVADFPGLGVTPGMGMMMSWTPDGKWVLVVQESGERPDSKFENSLLDPETGKTESLDLPSGVRVLDCARDGKTFLVTYHKDKKYRLGLVEKGDKEARELTELKVRSDHSVVGRLSPDGMKVLFTDANPEQKDAFKWHQSSQPHVLNLATKKREPLAEFPENGQAIRLTWSPDGKRIAYTWVELHPDLLKKDERTLNDTEIETEAFLIVADADGKNTKTVASAKGPNAIDPIYGSIDWR